MEKELRITKHLLKRYVEIFVIKPNYLLTALKISVWHRTFAQKKAIRLVYGDIKKVFGECKETKSHMNNKAGLGYLYGRYGFDTKYSFFHNHNIMFIITQGEGTELKGITCYSLKEYGDTLFANLTKKKFKKKTK